MTVSSTSNRVQYNCNGSLTDFDFTFKVFADADLTVIITDSDSVETTLTLDSDYTVSRNSDQDSDPGGTVTTTETYASGNTITIIRALGLTQETDYSEGGSFPASSHEDVADRLTMICQELNEKLGRALLLADSSSYSDLQLPDPESGKNLVWSSDLTELRNVTTTVEIIQVADATDGPGVIIADNVWIGNSGATALENLEFLLTNLKDVNISSLTNGNFLTVSGGKVTEVNITNERIRGWIEFNGTGTIAIKDSFNVSSITDDATGKYTVTWDTDFSTAYYGCTVTSNTDSCRFGAKAAGTVAVQTLAEAAGVIGFSDAGIVCVIAIGDQ